MFLRAILDCGKETQNQGQKTKLFFLLPQKYNTMGTPLSSDKSLYMDICELSQDLSWYLGYGKYFIFVVAGQHKHVGQILKTGGFLILQKKLMSKEYRIACTLISDRNQIELQAHDTYKYELKK